MAAVAIFLALPARAGSWDAVTNTTLPIITFTPQTEIPGSGLTAQVAKTIDQPETFIGGVIVGVYRYGVWLTITAAIFATMLGGLLWMLAGGNASRVDTAKRLIGSSLFGLVLAFTSYLILQGINPRLLELKLPVLPKVQLEEATLICCKDPVVAGTPQTYHTEQDISAKESTETKCRDGSDAVVGVAGACAATCCVCIVEGGFFARETTGIGAICYGGEGLTSEWCETETNKPQLRSTEETFGGCASYRGSCDKAAKDIRAKEDSQLWMGTVPLLNYRLLLDRLRDSFSCDRTFNRN